MTALPYIAAFHALFALVIACAALKATPSIMLAMLIGLVWPISVLSLIADRWRR